MLEVATSPEGEGLSSSKESELGRTASLCPYCKSLVPAEVFERGGSVLITRTCEVHGPTETLLSSDAAYYRRSLQYDKPGRKALQFNTAIERGCPFDCGLCPDHQQHTCLGILEITQRCNLECPVCFADSSPKRTRFLSMAECEAAIDNFVRCEGAPEVLMLSGGEPTIHPEVREIVEMAMSRGVRYVTINTNGIRLGDEAFARDLARAHPYIYLQFDGFRPETYRALRGVDLRAAKERAFENLRRFDMPTILVPTLYRGVNEDEIGDIVRFALTSDIVRGVIFQPTTFVGRCLPPQPRERITIPDVLHGIEDQTDGALRMDDFLPVPCPWPPSSAIAYVWMRADGPIPIARLVNLDRYLDLITNRVLPEPTEVTVHRALEALLSSSAVPGSPKVASGVCVACNLPPDIAAIERRVKLFGVFAFCDEWNFDIRCAKKCCIHEILPSGKIIPFCNYNILYRQHGGELPR